MSDLGIQTGRESWWDSNEQEQNKMIITRIKKLKERAGE